MAERTVFQIYRRSRAFVYNGGAEKELHSNTMFLTNKHIFTAFPNRNSKHKDKISKVRGENICFST